MNGFQRQLGNKIAGTWDDLCGGRVGEEEGAVWLTQVPDL